MNDHDDQDITPRLPLLIMDDADDDPFGDGQRVQTRGYVFPPANRFPPAAECDRSALVAIADGATRGSLELLMSRPHVEAVCADYVDACRDVATLVDYLDESAHTRLGGLHTAAIDYYRRPTIATSRALESSAIRAAIARLEATGEPVRDSAVLLLLLQLADADGDDQLAEDDGRCDYPACECHTDASTPDVYG